jgi:hypothetical protein
MPKPPHFTIVVATFNRGRHIIPTIEAALDQSFRDFELIVVGDGATDDTLDQVPRSDARVSVIKLPVNSGSQAVPNNAGIAAARGRYVAYLGHDDIWMPDHLAALSEVLEATRCDVAVSGCAYHGPPSTELILITGLGEPLDPWRHFFPPTSLAHRVFLAAEIGGWRDPRTISAPVDADFLLRAADAGARFVSTGRVTAQKFAAGHRYLSYLEPASDEQRSMLADIRSGAVNREVCMGYIEHAKAAGTFMTAGHMDYSLLPAGRLHRDNRSNKGIDRRTPVALTKKVYVAQSMEPRALDWYPPEQAAGIKASIRWSGPNLRPKLLIPFTGDIDAQITLHLSDRDPARVIAGIHITFNGDAIGHRTRRVDPDHIDLEFNGHLRPDKPSFLELRLPRAFTPADQGRSGRRLGVILTGFTIAPRLAPWSQRLPAAWR